MEVLQTERKISTSLQRGTGDFSRGSLFPSLSYSIAWAYRKTTTATCVVSRAHTANQFKLLSVEN